MILKNKYQIVEMEKMIVQKCKFQLNNRFKNNKILLSMFIDLYIILILNKDYDPRNRSIILRSIKSANVNYII